MNVTQAFLINNPDTIFVFGDNLKRRGYGGAAKFRDLENAYGFITKKFPSNHDTSFYKPQEYYNIYHKEIKKLKEYICLNKNKIFLISRIGGGLANKYNIFEQVIEPNIKTDLIDLSNVKFLF